MRKKRTRNLQVSERGVVRYAVNDKQVITVWFKEASEPDRPYRLELTVVQADVLAELLLGAVRRATDHTNTLAVEVVR